MTSLLCFSLCVVAIAIPLIPSVQAGDVDGYVCSPGERCTIAFHTLGDNCRIDNNGVPQGTCWHCRSDSNARVDICTEEPDEECDAGGGGIVDCGQKFDGTCVPDPANPGGAKCQRGFPNGNCHNVRECA